MRWVFWVVLLGACGACGRFRFEPVGKDGAGDSGLGDAPVPFVDGAVPGVDLNVVFVTAADVVPGSLGGLAGADARCQADADAAGLGGTYVAWLSTSTTNAIDRLGGARGWVRPDGVMFADTSADIVARRVLSPASQLADGTDLSFDAMHSVVTGTDFSGVISSSGTCGDWSRTDATSSPGFLNSTTRWTIEELFPGAVMCTDPIRLYCFGTTYSVPVIAPPITGRRAFLSITDAMPGSSISAFDAVCQTDADTYSLGGMWRAFVATSTASAASRFSSAAGRWQRLDGIPLAPTAVDLLTTGLRVPLNLGPDGIYRNAAAGTAWTGADTVTVVGGLTCGDWMITNASSSARLGGYVYGGSRSFNFASIRCDSNLPLYCLEL